MRFSRELPYGARQYSAGGHSSSPSSRLKASANRLERVLPLQRYALFLMRMSGYGFAVSIRVVPRSIYDSSSLSCRGRGRDFFVIRLCRPIKCAADIVVGTAFGSPHRNSRITQQAPDERPCNSSPEGRRGRRPLQFIAGGDTIIINCQLSIIN